MIICICNNVSDRHIRQAVEEGMHTMTQLRQTLQVGTCCGKCHSCAKRVLRDCLEQTALPVLAQPQPMMFQRNASVA